MKSINERVAEALGLEDTGSEASRKSGSICTWDRSRRVFIDWNWERRISDAIELLEGLDCLEWSLTWSRLPAVYSCAIYDGMDVIDGNGKTPAEAICLAWLEMKQSISNKEER